jgi:uncharacterized protein with von Willebrand factor type A (vWA) domain
MARQVDGQLLLGRAVGFGRALRKAGLGIDLAAAIDFARALEIVGIEDRDQVKAAGAAVFVRRKDDRDPYDITFERYWRNRLRLDADAVVGDEWSELVPADGEGAGEEPQLQGDERVERGEDQAGIPLPGEHDEIEDAGEADSLAIAPDAYSKLEALRHREFDRMTPAELRDAERLVDLLVPKLERRRTRRYELHPHGRRLAPRAMFRRNLSTGGEIVHWVWRRAVKRPRPLVVICDISGSMERHSRLLLRFVQALAATSAVKTESFVLGTRLNRVTPLLRDRDRQPAHPRVGGLVTAWGGGTRIGESFHEFNVRWARRTLRTSGVVIVVSDGWDRGDPALVAVEAARLRRNCHRLVWLNPLAGTAGYQPLAAGMRAAFPYIDDFLAAGTIASLERLGEVLGGARAADVRRGSEAAAHVQPVPPSEQPAAVASPVAVPLPMAPEDPGAAPRIS